MDVQKQILFVFYYISSRYKKKKNKNTYPLDQGRHVRQVRSVVMVLVVEQVSVEVEVGVGVGVEVEVWVGLDLRWMPVLVLIVFEVEV